jgi:hypothetical protein
MHIARASPAVRPFWQRSIASRRPRRSAAFPETSALSAFFSS